MHGVLIAIPNRKGAWCGRVAQRHPDVRAVVESMIPLEDGGVVETISLRGQDVDGAVRTVLSTDSGTEAQLIEKRPGLARLQVRTPECGVACVSRCTGLVPDFPFDVSSRGDMWLILGQKDRLKEAMDTMRAEGLDPSVVWSGEHPLGKDLLTVHQRNVLLAAVEAGFYSFPRRITLTRLAGLLGVSKATLSETLMVIEAKIMKREVNGGAKNIKVMT